MHVIIIPVYVAESALVPPGVRGDQRTSLKRVEFLLPPQPSSRDQTPALGPPGQTLLPEYSCLPVAPNSHRHTLGSSPQYSASESSGIFPERFSNFPHCGGMPGEKIAMRIY